MRWGPAFLLPLALAASRCLPPKLELGTDGAAGQGGSASPDASQPIDGARTDVAGGADGIGGAAGSGASGRGGIGGMGGNSGAAGNGGAAGNNGAAGKSGAAGSGGAAGIGGAAGNGGAAGSGGAAGTGGTAGAGGAAGKGGAAGNSGAKDGGPTGDATGGQAGTGTGGKDAASDVPRPACYDLSPTVLFCDDFEAATLGSWKTFRAEDAAIDGESRRDTTVRHGGNGALYSRKDGVGDGTPVYVDVLGKRTSGHLYLRTWLYLQSPLPGSIPVGSTASLLVLGESAYPYDGVALALARDSLGLTIRGQVNDHVAKPSYVLPSNQWLCLQIDFAIGPAAVPRIRINGQNLNAVLCPVQDAGTCNMLMRTSYDRLWMGINWSNYDPPDTMPAVVFYDDVVVSTTDIACD
jgi:hypothetical protein